MLERGIRLRLTRESLTGGYILAARRESKIKYGNRLLTGQEQRKYSRQPKSESRRVISRPRRGLTYNSFIFIVNKMLLKARIQWT